MVLSTLFRHRQKPESKKPRNLVRNQGFSKSKVAVKKGFDPNKAKILYPAQMLDYRQFLRTMDTYNRALGTRMGKANNLELQGGTYHVRLAIPKDVQKDFGGRRILSKSLKTGSHKEALDRRLHVLAEWKSQIKAFREGVPLPEGWQEKYISVHNRIEEYFKNKKLAQIGIQAPTPPLHNPEFAARIRNDPEFIANVESFVKNSHFKDGMEGKIQLYDALTEIAHDMLPEVWKQQLNPKSEQFKEVGEIAANPSSYKTRSPFNKQLLQQFREYREQHHISAKNIDTQESRLKKIGAYLAQEGKELNFDNVVTFIKTIDRSPVTQQQYVLAGGAFWKWAMKYNPDWREKFKNSAPPFSNHEFPKLKGRAKVEASRKNYNQADASKLHAGALKYKQTVLANLIVLGYYTGARIEELCQLRKEHLILEDGVLIFDIIDSKSPAGIRRVPVHPNLIPLVKDLADTSSDGWLLPINTKNKYNRRSGPLSKKFGRLRTKLGFSSNYVYHSFRMTSVTELVRAGIPGTLIAELVGHLTKTITFDVYSQGASTKQKFEAISKIPPFSQH